MKRIASILLIFISLFHEADATHIFGGELYYKYIAGNTYKINLALYADCSGQAFPQLFNYPIKIVVLRNGTRTDSLTLSMETDSVKEITPVCNLYKDSTTCKSLTNTIIGVTKFVYTDTITLPVAPATYTFVFDGADNGAGRTANINNILFASQTQIYLTAELNTAFSNNSPEFTTNPTPFYCVNISQSFNQGAVDADDDSLAFELANALNGGGITAIYASGYTAQEPIESGGSFAFNTVNGQMDFTPSIIQNCVVVNKVMEYRNGQLIGTSMREMTFIVIDNCNNLPVNAIVDSTKTAGGLWTSGNVLNVCTGTPQVQFQYNFGDPDGDTIDLSYLNIPPGATLTILGNGTVDAAISFSWNTSVIPAGNYTFFVTAKDRHCPLSTVQTKAFTIRIVKENEVSYTVLKPTQCAHKAVLQFNINQGLSPRNFELKEGNTVLKIFSDTASSFIDSLYAGNYRLIVSSQNLLCPTFYDFTVADSGIFPYHPLFNENIVCKGDDAHPLKAIAFPGAVLHWFDIAGNPLPDAPTPSTAVTNTQYWLISQLYKVCESEKDTVAVEVVQKPQIQLLIDTGSVCIGTQIFLKASGAENFSWLPKEKLFYEPDSSIFIRIYKPETFTVIGSNLSGCSDTLNFSYTNMEQCCTFSYPSAFTPNGDGKNDSWRPIVYGIQGKYELSIYNRWGQNLFHSFIPNEAWDGKFNEVIQETGSYYYVLRAKCITGKEEFKTGSFTLIH